MKKVLFLLTITASLFIIKDLVYSIYTLWSKKDLLLVAQKQLRKEKQEYVRLKAAYSEVKKPLYIESQARNKLFLVKPGEQEVVLPQLPEESKAAQAAAHKANWQQWQDLFF